ncbi:MAG: hypothetical protein JXQ79_03205 [Rhodobacteraceae bacterium]|nr:hypothetical protein [Paracoccaceae bacterium]
MTRPLHRCIRARVRLGLLVGPNGAPDPLTVRLRWSILRRDRAARIAELKQLPGGDAA